MESEDTVILTPEEKDKILKDLTEEDEEASEED
ncbi:MAG: hypothetical protein ACI822_001439 [Gammaproteobacteria bacterium]|jgi:hypothetical protein